MKKWLMMILCASVLVACSASGTASHNEMYGEIKGGVEHTHKP